MLLTMYNLQVSIHSVWLGNNITPLREEEWGEDEEDEADAPAPASPPLSPINSRSDLLELLAVKLLKTSILQSSHPALSFCLPCPGSTVPGLTSTPALSFS